MSDVTKNRTKEQVSSKKKMRPGLEEDRARWLKDNEQLQQDTTDSGYGDPTFKDILKASIDISANGQANASRLIALQNRAKTLQKEKESLWPEETVVEELNKKHAAIHIDQFYVLTEKPNAYFETQREFCLESRQSLINLYENQTVITSEGKIENKARIWLQSQNRRTFNGMVFDPKCMRSKQITNPITGEKEEYYNIWKGFAKIPRAGSCERLKAHIKDVICSGNSEDFDYVWKWLANLVQRPDKPSTALLLMGSQGTGKGIFVKAVGQLFGQHFIQLDNLTHVVGNFNSHLRTAVLVFCDEAVWGGNKKDIGRLKAMITEEHAIIEQKGKDAISVPNFRHYVFASNEAWPIHLDRDDRRVKVLQVSEKHKEDHPYFREISEELENGGYEAFLHELQNVDLSNFNVHALVQNKAAFDVKMQSAHSTAQYLYEALKAGKFDIGSTYIGVGKEWDEEISRETVYSDYSTWCVTQGKNRGSNADLGRTISEIIPSVKNPRRRENGDRVRKYGFQNLEKTRVEFQKSYKAGAEIWD